MQNPAFSTARSLTAAIVERIRSNHLDEAQTLLEQLNIRWPATRDLLILPVMMAIQRGRPHEAWQIVNGLPDDAYPELKALCLRLLNDPTWHSYAQAGLAHPSARVRCAMRNLLGCIEPGDVHALQQ